MAETVRRELKLDADVVAALDARSLATGIPVDRIVSDALRHELDDREPIRETRNGVRLVRRSKSGRKVTAEEIIALWEELD